MLSAISAAAVPKIPSPHSIPNIGVAALVRTLAVLINTIQRGESISCKRVSIGWNMNTRGVSSPSSQYSNKLVDTEVVVILIIGIVVVIVMVLVLVGYTHLDTGRRSQVNGINSPEALRTRSISEEENKTQHISPHTLGLNNTPNRDRTTSSSSNRQHPQPQPQFDENGQLRSQDHGNAAVPRQSILPRNGIPELETSYSQQSPHSIHNSSTTSRTTTSSSANNSQVIESDDEHYTTTPTAAAEAELDRVFQNDYFNSFFSFLQRKPSTSMRQEEEESDRNSKKTR